PALGLLRRVVLGLLAGVRRRAVALQRIGVGLARALGRAAAVGLVGLLAGGLGLLLAARLLGRVLARALRVLLLAELRALTLRLAVAARHRRPARAAVLAGDLEDAVDVLDHLLALVGRVLEQVSNAALLLRRQRLAAGAGVVEQVVDLLQALLDLV